MAVVGKGGVGKSMVAGTLARLFAQGGHRVLALDSDPMPGLAISLGMGNLTEPMLNDAVEKDLNNRWHLKPGIGGARAVSRYSVVGPDGVRFLQSGKSDSTGLWSSFASVSAFGQVVHRIARDGVLADWSIVGDLSAGTRQAAFHWAPYASRYLVVVEPTWKSVLTGRRLVGFASDRGAAQIDVIVNKATDGDGPKWVGEELDIQPIAVLPEDSSVALADRDGRALVDVAPESPVVTQLERLATLLGKAGSLRS